MKNLALSLLIFFSSSILFAQGIFTTVKKYDKFDDVLWNRTVKTLITQNDTAIIIETKGQKPEVYLYFDYPFFCMHIGRKDSLENIAEDLWGYETQYIAFPEQQLDKLAETVYSEIQNEPDSLRNPEYFRYKVFMKMIENVNKFPIIRFRTISSSQYIFKYDTEVVWIRYPDGSRTIYYK